MKTIKRLLLENRILTRIETWAHNQRMSNESEIMSRTEIYELANAVRLNALVGKTFVVETTKDGKVLRFKEVK